MDIYEIREKYNSGGYTYKASIPTKVSLDHVFDEELSVRRNRELAQEHNENVDRLHRDERRIQNELDKRFTYDIVKYLMDTYNLTEAQANKVESFVYQEHHSYMSDYFCYIDTYGEFAEDLITCEEKTND